MWPIQQIYFHKSCLTSKILTSNVQNLQRIFFMTPQAADIVLPMLCICLYMNIGFSRSLIQRQKKAVRLNYPCIPPTQKIDDLKKTMLPRAYNRGKFRPTKLLCRERYACILRRLLSSFWPVSGVRVKCQISTFMKTATYIYMHRIIMTIWSC
jgi:hypothetical protein